MSALFRRSTDRNLLKACLLLAISLAFGIMSLRYSMGSLARPGPGFFPLIVSCLLGVLALMALARSLSLEAVPLRVSPVNIAIIFCSLFGFALVSKYFNMMAGTVFLVFAAAAAGRKYSITRNIMVAGGLIGIALFFHHILGLSIPLY